MLDKPGGQKYVLISRTQQKLFDSDGWEEGGREEGYVEGQTSIIIVSGHLNTLLCPPPSHTLTLSHITYINPLVFLKIFYLIINEKSKTGWLTAKGRRRLLY